MGENEVYDLMSLLGKGIMWNNKHYNIHSYSVEPEGVQVWDGHMWFYFRDGEWRIYSELSDEECGIKSVEDEN